MSLDIDRIRKETDGLANNGSVGIEYFDRGVVETLGAVTADYPIAGYYLKNIFDEPPEDTIRSASGGVSGPNGFPGVPVIFSFPEDRDQKYKLPMLLIRRDSLDPAMNRWHPGTTQYVAPHPGARTVSVNRGSVGNPRILTGPDQRDIQQMAVPYDITYSIKVISRFRGQVGNTNHVNALVTKVMRTYPPYCALILKDSLGDFRSYEATTDIVGVNDESFELADRVLGFDISLRVQGELDLSDPYTVFVVTNNPAISFRAP